MLRWRLCKLHFSFVSWFVISSSRERQWRDTGEENCFLLICWLYLSCHPENGPAAHQHQLVPPWFLLTPPEPTTSLSPQGSESALGNLSLSLTCYHFSLFSLFPQPWELELLPEVITSVLPQCSLWRQSSNIYWTNSCIKFCLNAKYSFSFPEWTETEFGWEWSSSQNTVKITLRCWLGFLVSFKLDEITLNPDFTSCLHMSRALPKSSSNSSRICVVQWLSVQAQEPNFLCSDSDSVDCIPMWPWFLELSLPAL